MSETTLPDRDVYDLTFHSVNSVPTGGYSFTVHLQTKIPQPDKDDTWLITAPRLFETWEHAGKMAEKCVSYLEITGQLPVLTDEAFYVNPIPEPTATPKPPAPKDQNQSVHAT